MSTLSLATVTHELKNSLTSIRCYVGRLLLLQSKVEPLNERQERYLARVQGSSRRIKALIDDLLDISRIESGGLELCLAGLAV